MLEGLPEELCQQACWRLDWHSLLRMQRTSTHFHAMVQDHYFRRQYCKNMPQDVLQMLQESNYRVDVFEQWGIPAVQTGIMPAWLPATETEYQPLYAAIRQRNFAMTAFLLEHVDPQTCDADDFEYLMHETVAAPNMHIGFLIMCLMRRNLYTVHHAHQVFCMAAHYGHVEAVQLFLDKGVQCNYEYADDGNTALDSAILRGHTAVVQLLLPRTTTLDNVLYFAIVADEPSLDILRLLRDDPRVPIEADGMHAVQLAQEYEWREGAACLEECERFQI